jgi:hypothetical protein
MIDECITLHLTKQQRAAIKRRTGKDPATVVFRLGELQQRIALQDERNEDADAALEELLHAHP